MDFDLDFFFYLFIVSETVLNKCKCNYTIKPSGEEKKMKNVKHVWLSPETKLLIGVQFMY